MTLEFSIQSIVIGTRDLSYPMRCLLANRMGQTRRSPNEKGLIEPDQVNRKGRGVPQAFIDFLTMRGTHGG